MKTQVFLKYLSYVLRHKWFVFVECAKMGLVWRGIVHDWSKFLPDEFVAYANYFYGGKGLQEFKDNNYSKPRTVDEAFNFAWLLHQKRNPHHHQWWLLQEDGGTLKVLEMDDISRKEMLADWRGAGKAQNNPDSASEWYRKNKNKILLGPQTRQWIEQQLYRVVLLRVENTEKCQFTPEEPMSEEM